MNGILAVPKTKESVQFAIKLLVQKLLTEVDRLSRLHID